MLIASFIPTLDLRSGLIHEGWRRGETAGETLDYGTSVLSRRSFRAASALLVASGSLFLATSKSLLAAGPGHAWYEDTYSDFTAHIKEIERYGRNSAGSDYSFLHAIPVTSPVRGTVRYVQDFKHGSPERAS